jgi:hypothetical protein
MFSNTEVYQYKDSITVTDQSGKSIAQKMGTQAEFLYGADLYEQHNYSRYYAALFTSVNRIILSSLSGSFKTVANIPQKSFIVSGGLTYTSLNEFFAGFLINGYIGGKNTEYTYKNQALSLQVTAGVTF